MSASPLALPMPTSKQSSNPILVIWDVHSDSTRRSPFLVRSKILSLLRKMGYYGSVNIIVFKKREPVCDLQDEFEDEFSFYGTGIIAIPIGDEEETLNSMLLHILFWTFNNRQRPGFLVVLSDDEHFGQNSQGQDKFTTIREVMEDKNFIVSLLKLDTLMGIDLQEEQS